MIRISSETNIINYLGSKFQYLILNLNLYKHLSHSTVSLSLENMKASIKYHDYCEYRPAHAKGGVNQTSTNFYQQSQQMMNSGLIRQRFAPYPFYKRTYAHTLIQPTNHRLHQKNASSNVTKLTNSISMKVSPISLDLDFRYCIKLFLFMMMMLIFLHNPLMIFVWKMLVNSSRHLSQGNHSYSVTLQISNLDTTIEENELKQCLMNRLKPIASGNYIISCIIIISCN